MARRMICGFEMGDTIELAASAGAFSIQSSIKRSGDYALRVNPTGAASGYVDLNGRTAGGAITSFNAATLYHRFYFLAATLPASGSEEIMAAYSALGTRKFSVRITSAGKLQAYQNDGTTQLGSDGATVLTTGQWYCLEVLVGTGAAGAYEVRIQKNVELTGTGNLATSNNARLQLGKIVNRNSQDVDFYYDDVATDDAGYPGSGSIVRLDPDSDGDTTQWTGTYADVDEIPHDGDTTYLTTSINSDVELVNLESALGAGVAGPVLTVLSHAVARDEGGASQLKVRLKSGGTSDNTSNTDVGTSYASYAKLYKTDPATAAAWLNSALESLQVGVVSGAAVAHRCTSLCAMVEFRPQAARAMAVTRHRRA